MANHPSAYKILNLLIFLVLCEFLGSTSSVPVIIKNSIKVDKSYNAVHQQQKSRILPTSQNNILSRLKNTINAGKNDYYGENVGKYGENVSKKPENNEPHLLGSQTKKWPSTPTTLKLKNAIRVLGYVGNKQIIPIAQQRQASVTLPDDVVSLDETTTTEITTETATEDISNIIDTIDQLIINNKVQLIDLTENDVGDKGREDEEVECEVKPDTSSTFIRNGLGDDSFFTWPDGKIPFIIGDGFNSSNKQNILDSVDYYNNLFGDCIKWVPRSDESVYVEFLHSGICYSRIGRVYWPFPLPQSIFLGRCAHLIGHVKHEMMHTMGFYHEHSRSDRDDFIDINWDNIADGREDQFETYRWTTAYGESYDYDSIMHYSDIAFSKNPFGDEPKLTITPKSSTVNHTSLGRKVNLSETDIIKIKKLYKCPPYNNWDNGCGADNECGFNEHCSGITALGLLRGNCRTLLSDGSVCVRNEECLNICSGGRCTSCTQDGHCKQGQYCANTLLPLVENKCSGWCEDICMVSAQCGGSCPVCSWRFRCEKQTRSNAFLNSIPIF